MESPKRAAKRATRGKLTPIARRVSTKKASPSAKFSSQNPTAAQRAPTEPKITRTEMQCIEYVLNTFAVYDSGELKQRSEAIHPEHKKLIRSCLKVVNRRKISAAEKKAIVDFVKAERA